MDFVESFGLGHVGLNVTDIAAASSFFQTALAFEVLLADAHNGSPYIFLGHNGKLEITLWQQSTGTFAKAQPGLHHLAFRVADADQLAAVHERLVANNTTIYHDGIVAHGESRTSSAIYFEGPDGIRLEVSAPNGGANAPVPVSGAPTCGFF